MPYTEKRGDGEYPWRVKWPLPGKKTASGKQMYDSASGFADEDTARDYGLDREAEIRMGRYRDPRKEQTPLAAWADTWMAAQVCSDRTRANREGDLRNHLLPAFGHVPLAEINWWLVSTWAAKQPCARDSTRHRISLLSEILTGAVDNKLIEYNPVRGRRLGGTPEKAEEKVWPTVTEAVAICERLGRIGEKWTRPDGALRADASELLAPMLRVLGYVFNFTGLRSGEAYGLHRDNCGLLRRGTVDGKRWVRRVIRIDPEAGQLVDHYDRDTSRHVRYLGPPKPPNGSREIDLPPFLEAMLDRHLAVWPHPYLFCAPDARFAGGLDLTRNQEGLWLPRHTFDAALTDAADGRPGRRQGNGFRALDAWEPIRPGLTPHGCRHGHQTSMIEDEIPEVMRCDRLGHEKSGIQGLYSHPSDALRKRLVDKLQARYERALGELDNAEAHTA